MPAADPLDRSRCPMAGCVPGAATGRRDRPFQGRRNAAQGPAENPAAPNQQHHLVIVLTHQFPDPLTGRPRGPACGGSPAGPGTGWRHRLRCGRRVVLCPDNPTPRPGSPMPGSSGGFSSGASARTLKTSYTMEVGWLGEQVMQRVFDFAWVMSHWYRQWKIKRHGPSAEAVDLNISLAQPDLRLPPGYLKKVNSTSLVS